MQKLNIFVLLKNLNSGIKFFSVPKCMVQGRDVSFLIIPRLIRWIRLMLCVDMKF